MIKYKAGYFYNPGRDEHGNESITHTVIVGIEEGEADKLPSRASIWKRYLDKLEGRTIQRFVMIKKAGKEYMMDIPLRMSHLFVVPESDSIHSLYRRTYIRKG